MSDSSSSSELVDIDTDDTDDETYIPDDTGAEPPSKRHKGKTRAAKAPSPEPEPEPEVEPASEVIKYSPGDWTDMPNWQERDGSPLMKMPAEILDLIFCVRPELGLRDYISLAGTCRFFRHYMTDDFWQSLVRDRHPSYRADGKLSKTVKTPYSRHVPTWRVPHPHYMLPEDEYPIITRRSDSQWDDISTGNRSESHQSYFQGHYVPRGPRSEWTKSQYKIYKEEQAIWRECRDLHRSQGLETMFEELCDSQRRDTHKRMVHIGPYHYAEVIDEIKGTLKVGIAGWRSNDNAGRNWDGGSSEISSDANDVGAKEQVENTCTEVSTINGGEHDSSNDWEAPDSEASETEDEFEWPRHRGAKLEHDHWPSEWRTTAVSLISQLCMVKSSAIDEFGFDDNELKTLKAFKVVDLPISLEHLSAGSINRMSSTQSHLKKKHSTHLVWCIASLEARAYKLHCGVARHNAFMAALAKSEER